MRWLEQAPATIEAGRYGTFRGPVTSSKLEAAAKGYGIGRLARLARQKRWQWFALMGERVWAGGAIVQLGYAAKAFVWVFEDGRLVADEELLVPRQAVRVSETPGYGEIASLSWPGVRARFVREAGEFNVSFAAGGVEIAGTILADDVTEASAICPVAGGGINLTQKGAGARAKGVVRMGSRSLSLGSGAVGLLDYTHGLMARRTDWLWAIGGSSAASEPRGFNLISGFNDDLESVAWVGAEPRRLSPASFEFDERDPCAPWRVRGEEGDYDLVLEPTGVRRDDSDFKVVASTYAMPAGRWSGELLGERFEGLGVAEVHSATW